MEEPILDPIFLHLLRGVVLGMACWAIWWLLHLMLPRSRSVGYTFWRGVIVLLLGMTIVQLGPARSLVRVEAELIQPVSSEEVTLYDRVRNFRATPDLAEDGVVSGTGASESLGWLVLGLLLQSLTWLWILGILLGGINLAAAHLRLARIRRGARLMEDAELLSLLETGRQKLGITRPVELQCHPDVDVPFTWGIWRPRIVMPEKMDDWPPKDRQMAILHELAHIRGYDTLFQGLASLLGLLHWMNPLIWMGWRRFAMDRELHADAAVLATGVSPTSYASLLVRLAGCRNRPSPIAIAAVSMARPSTVPKRVSAILSGSLNQKGVRAPILWISMGMLGGIALTLGLTSLTRNDAVSGSNEGFLYKVYRVPEELASKLGYTPPQPPPESEENAAKVGSLNLNVQSIHTMLSSGYVDVTDRLESSFGVPHEPGNYAVIDGGSLIVRCSPASHTLLHKSLQEHLGTSQTKQIYLTTKVVHLDPDSPYSLPWMPESRSGTPLELAGVFSDPQFQVIIRALTQDPGTNLVSLPSLAGVPGETCRVEMGSDYQIEFLPELTSDDETIEIYCDVRSSKLAHVTSKVSIWDGQTVALAHRDNGRIEALTFITARLIESAGLTVQ